MINYQNKKNASKSNQKQCCQEKQQNIKSSNESKKNYHNVLYVHVLDYKKKI